MKVVGSRELKRRLGTYLRQARAGMTILITNRGRPVAELRPSTPTTSYPEVRLAALAESGLLTSATKRLPAAPRPVRLRGGSIAETIALDREDRI